jgi:hypothetical protein
MKRVRIVGVCLVAAFAMSAVVTATASAELPEFQGCNKYKGGLYPNNSCLKPGQPGKYELQPWNTIPNKEGTGKAGEGRLTTYIKGVGIVAELKCKSSKSTIIITGPKSISLKLTDKGCESSGKKCASAGQKPGVIETNLILGDLIYLDPPANTKVGILIEPEEGHGPYLAEFNCEGLIARVAGSIKCEIKGPLKTGKKEAEVVCAVNAGGEQVYSSENPLVTEIVEVGTFESGLQTTEDLKFKSSIEIVY